MEDERIIELYFERKPEAIHETAGKYGSYCDAIAIRVLGNRQDAEECVNDTYMAAWEQIPPARPTRLGVFLGKITRNIAVSRWRSNTAEKRGGLRIDAAIHELDRTLASGFDVNESVLAGELRGLLRSFLYELQEPERRVFLCRYWYFDSVGEIASRYGYSRSKVKSMLLRTRNKLRRYLLEKGGIEV